MAAHLAHDSLTLIAVLAALIVIAGFRDWTGRF